MTTRQFKGGGGVLPAVCNVLGIALIAVVVALCLPLTVPRVFGYEAYEIVSGSMEPAIPVGSVVYAKSVEPASVQQGDVIAFADGNGVVVHRVTANRTSSGEFATKGDANPIEDINPVPYGNFLGRVDMSIPVLGSFMTMYASVVGKVYLLMLLVCGILLNVLASRMRTARRRRDEEVMSAVLDGNLGSVLEGRENSASGAADGREAPAPVKRQRSAASKLRIAAIVVLAFVFLSSAGVVGYTMWQYYMSDALYNDASDRYTSDRDNRTPLQEAPPISIDFKALRAENPDVIGWIYCEDTPINYPVLYGTTNEQYLHTDYTGAYNIDGSIFVDCDNTNTFTDSNTIIYGHHMNSGSMFASLENWKDQSFYNDHPIMWLLTPTKNYKVVLFSGREVNAHSDLYQIVKEPGPRMDALLAEALEQSDFTADLSRYVPGAAEAQKTGATVKLEPRARYVMLSTCATIFDGDWRYVLHGLLVEV